MACGPFPAQLRPIAELRGYQNPALRIKGTLLAGICLVATCAYFSSWIHVQNIGLNYRLSQRHRLQQDLNRSRDSLEIERQMLRSPQRITGIAENELGMHLPAAGERVVLR